MNKQPQHPLIGVRPFTDIVEIALAAGGRAEGVIAWYRGAGEIKFVGVQLRDRPGTVVPCRVEDCRPTGRCLPQAA